LSEPQTAIVTGASGGIGAGILWFDDIVHNAGDTLPNPIIVRHCSGSLCLRRCQCRHPRDLRGLS